MPQIYKQLTCKLSGYLVDTSSSLQGHSLQAMLLQLLPPSSWTRAQTACAPAGPSPTLQPWVCIPCGRGAAQGSAVVYLALRPSSKYHASIHTA